MTDDYAAIPVTRDCIVREFADGSLGVRIVVDADDAAIFYSVFQETSEPVFLSDGSSAIEAVRGPILSEKKDGSVSFRLTVDAIHKRRFMEIWPKPDLPAVLAAADPETGRKRMIDAAAGEAPKEPAPYGRYARVLRTHVSFMLARKVWEAVGTDEEYLEWCKHQKCAKCRWTPHWEMDTFMLCDPAHVRRVSDGSGTGIKPAYSAIPLCHKCHVEQHTHGESYLGGKESFDKLRIQHVQSWLWETLKMQLGFAHWSEIPPETLVAWAREHDLVDALPDCYLEEL